MMERKCTPVPEKRSAAPVTRRGGAPPRHPTWVPLVVFVVALQGVFGSAP